jgi:hypothetical protein
MNINTLNFDISNLDVDYILKGIDNIRQNRLKTKIEICQQRMKTVNQIINEKCITTIKDACESASIKQGDYYQARHFLLNLYYKQIYDQNKQKRIENKQQKKYLVDSSSNQNNRSSNQIVSEIFQNGHYKTEKKIHEEQDTDTNKKQNKKQNNTDKKKSSKIDPMDGFTGHRSIVV